IAFFGTEDFAGSYVYVINADGTGLRRVVMPHTTSLVRPAWSPDGTRLLYEAEPDYNQREIRSVKLHGTDERVPTSAPRPTDFASRSSKPRPQSFGSMRPRPGTTPLNPGNWTVVASASVSAAISCGRCSSDASSRRSSSDPCKPDAGEPRSSAASPSGRSTAP